MDQATKRQRTEDEQIAILMFQNNSRQQAIQAYEKYGESTSLAADSLHFDRIMNNHFCDHTRNIMTSNKSIAIYIFYIASLLRILKDTDDYYEFSCLIHEFINIDRVIVFSQIGMIFSFNEALKKHFKSLLSSLETKRMLDVTQAFHDALYK